MRGHHLILLLVLLFGLHGVSKAAEDSEPKSVKERRLELIDASARRSYLDAFELYRGDIDAKPYDILLTLERCDFLRDILGRFADGGPPWTNEVEEESEQCEADVSERFADHPEILLRQLENEYGESAVTAGEKLLRNDLSLWTAAQLGRLHSHLAQAYDTQNKHSAKRYALNALRFDQQANVRLIAARWHIRDREFALARDVLTSPLDFHGKSQPYYLIQKAKLLSQVDARDDVLALYEQLNKSQQSDYSRIELVQALLDVNAIDEARSELSKANESRDWDHSVQFRRFMLEYKHGTPEEALDAYNKLRDSGLETDPMLQYRVALLARSVTLPWKVRDLAGVGIFLLILLGIACLPLVILGGVHYRGLARRFAVLSASPSVLPPESTLPNWSLGSAWYALALVFWCSIVSIYFVGPLEFDGNGWNWAALLNNPKQLSLSVVIESLLQAFAAIPLLLVARSNGTALTTNFTLVKALWVGALLGFLFRLPSLVMFLFSSNKALIQQNAPEIIQVMLDLKLQFGVGAVLIVAAVAAPIVEELLFRGVVLGAFSKHIGFWWANLLQAAIFASIHMEPLAIPLLFALAVAAGVLVKRSGGLLPSIVMHAVFNALMLFFLMAPDQPGHAN